MSRSRESLYAAMDVGTTKVATLIARVSSQGAIEVVAAGHAPSEGMRKGQVVSPSELVGPIRASAAEAEAILGRRLPPVLVGITGSHLHCINAGSGEPAAQRRARAISQNDVDHLLSATAASGAGRGDRVVQVVPRSFAVDDLAGVHDPVGMSGERLRAEAHVVYGNAASMETLERVLRTADIPVRGMVLEHLASAEAVLTNDERAAGVVLVDIGGGTSDIAIYQDGALLHTASVPVAGQHFTSDLAVGMGMPLSIAEAVKLEHGNVSLEGVDSRSSIAVPTGIGDQTRLVSTLTLRHLLHDRATELMKMTLARVADSGLRRMPPGGIVLTGGCANLQGLVELAAGYGRCHARLGAPADALGLPAELRESAFATAVGLLVWGVQHRHAGAFMAEQPVRVSLASRLRGWLGRWQNPMHQPRQRPTGARV